MRRNDVSYLKFGILTQAIKWIIIHISVIRHFLPKLTRQKKKENNMGQLIYFGPSVPRPNL